MRKRIAALLLAAVLALSLAACGKKVENRELIVFAAASLEETLTEIGEAYMAENSGVTIRFNFDSSGTLKTQIQEGADCDLFLSAGQKQMNELEELGLLQTDTRRDILENQVVLAVPEGNPAGIGGFDDLAGRLTAGDVLLAMGNADVPVGQYTQKILTWYGLDEAALAAAGSITYGSNVKEVATQITEAAVDCGVIYSTDACSAGLTAVDAATEEMCGRVVYPAAALAGSKFPDQAADFLAYITSNVAAEIFGGVGFLPLSQK